MTIQVGLGERSNGSDAFFLYILTAIMFFAVLTTWMPSRWHLAVEQAGIFVLGIAWAVRQLFHPRPVRKSWLLVPVGIATAWGFCQLAVGRTAYPFATLGKSLEWLTCFVACFVALQLLAVEANRKWFRQTVLWFGFALSVVSIIQYFSSEGRIFWFYPNGFFPQILGPFVNRDHYSVLIELLLPLAIYNVRKHGQAAMYSTMAGIMYASGIAGASRAGAILTTSLVIVLTFIVSGRYFAHRRPARLILVASFAVLFSMVVGWQEVWDRLNYPDPFKGRRELNVASLKMLPAHTWLGFGLGTWPYVYPAYAIISLHVFANAAHDDWAQWAVEGGIGFAALMFAVLVWSALRAYQIPWAMGIPVMMIHCSVEFPMQVPALALWFFVMLGALAAVSGGRWVSGRRGRK
jgi:hypothetical protein